MGDGEWAKGLYLRASKQPLAQRDCWSALLAPPHFKCIKQTNGADFKKIAARLHVFFNVVLTVFFFFLNVVLTVFFCDYNQGTSISFNLETLRPPPVPSPPPADADELTRARAAAKCNNSLYKPFLVTHPLPAFS